jgi:hypothetical protein
MIVGVSESLPSAEIVSITVQEVRLPSFEKGFLSNSTANPFAIFADAKHKTFFVKIINIDWFYIIVFKYKVQLF